MDALQPIAIAFLLLVLAIVTKRLNKKWNDAADVAIKLREQIREAHDDEDAADARAAAADERANRLAKEKETLQAIHLETARKLVNDHTLEMARRRVDFEAKLEVEQQKVKNLADHSLRERANSARLETQLVNALQSTDRHVRLIENLEERLRQNFAAVEAEHRRNNDLAHLFKEHADKLFIDLEETRHLNRDLLETVKESGSQLIDIARELTGMQRLGFHRPNIATLPDTEPPKFGSVDDADAAAVKAAKNAVTIQAIDA